MGKLENKNKMDMIFEEALIKSHDTRSLLTMFKNKALIKGYRIFKNSVGSEFYISDWRTIKRILEFLNKKGIEIIPEKKLALLPDICFNAVKMIDDKTFMFITWDYEYDDNVSGYIYVFGKKSYKYYKKFNSFILEDDDRIRHTKVHTIYAYRNGTDTSWKGITKSIVSRPFNTLFFDNDIENAIKDHIDKWIKNKDIYKVRGITFKTGILLYGPPGTGKSSIGAAIANYLNTDIIIIDSASFKDLNINEVTSSINADDQMYVVLLDDIDVIFTSRTDDKITIDDKSNISKLLAFLDSNNSPDNVIFVATTNHIEVFDEAITRAGRFDKVIEIGNISKDTGKRMCKGFGLSTESADEVISSYDTDLINPADLQVKILNAMKDVEDQGEIS